MDGRVDGRMGGWTVRQMGRWSDRQIDGLTD